MKGGAPPGLFTALLGAAAMAAGPPGHAPTSARTAHAEGTPAEGDSSGHTDSHTTPSPMPTPAAPVAVPAAPAAPLPGPVDHGVRSRAARPAVAAHAAEPATRGPERPAATGRLAADPVTGSDGAPRDIPVPTVDRRPGSVVNRRPGEPAGGRPITHPKGAPGPVEVPARSPAASRKPGHRRPSGIPLPAPAPELTPRTVPAGPHQRPAAGTHVRRSAPAPAAASTPPADAPTARPAEHRSEAPANASRLPSVRVHELAESMHALVKVANRRGTAAARITLRPAALGGVQVRLRAHAGGVSASLTAQTSAGAQALGAAHGELRRALEAQGIAVHTIDVQLAGDRPGPEGRPQGWQPGGQHGSPQQAREDDEEFEPHHTIEPTRLPLADGQVDVLA